MKTQEEAIQTYMPTIEGLGTVYEKFTEIAARLATVGEVVVTVTAAGEETRNTAVFGDYIVRNNTGAQEQYILSGKKLDARYLLIDRENGVSDWYRYKATGECKAVKYTGPNTEFMASWGSSMVLQTGDMLCTPLPQKGEVYRIAIQEFGETYRVKK